MSTSTDRTTAPSPLHHARQFPFTADDLLAEVRASARKKVEGQEDDIDTLAALILELPEMLVFILDRFLNSFSYHQNITTELAQATRILAVVIVELENRYAVSLYPREKEDQPG